jgi:hypothetical protein
MKFSSAVAAIVVALFAHTVTALPGSGLPAGTYYDSQDGEAYYIDSDSSKPGDDTVVSRGLNPDPFIPIGVYKSNCISCEAVYDVNVRHQISGANSRAACCMFVRLEREV